MSEVKPCSDSGDGRPYVTVHVAGVEFRALVDTGAVVDLIGAKVAQHLRYLGQRPDATRQRLRLANGVGCSSEGFYEICGSVGGQLVNLRALYVPSLIADAILGIKTALKLGLVSFGTAVELSDPVTYGVDVMETTSGFEVGNANTRDSTPNGPGYPETRPIDTLRVPLVSPPGEEMRLREFLSEELPLFEGIPGKTHLMEHTIRLKDGATPIKQRHYPRNPAMQTVINQEVKDMLNDDVIEPSNSPWSSPIVMIKKSTGKFRFCIDMRKVNEASVKDAYPLPRINAILEKLRHAKYISTLDLYRGYWQVPLSPGSRPITAFTVPGLGLFQFKVMPFGLHSAGGTFQRLLDRIIGPEFEPKAFAYLDDLVIVSDTFEEHLEMLRVVFKRLRDAGLKLNPDKCRFGQTELRYLGHIVNRHGISTDTEKVRAITEYPTPHNVKTVRSFLGLASWYRRFVGGFAILTRPLTRLLRKDEKWSWGPEQEGAFAALKRALSTTPILACPDFDRQFVLQVDASNDGLGAALTQDTDGGETVIAYASRLLTEQERNYTTTEKECLALVWAVRKFRPYLEGYRFTAISDHVALRWLMSLDQPSGRLARWVMELQQHDFEIRYRKGVLNRVADALSRQPVDSPEESDVATLENRPELKGRIPDAGVPPDSGEPSTSSRSAEPSGPSTGPQESGHGLWYRKLFNGVNNKPRKYPQYRVREGKLFRTFGKLHQRDVSWKLVVPPERVADVLNETHDAVTAGHLGVKKTLYRVGNSYFWPGWRRDVKRHVRSCLSCQAHKVEQAKPAGLMYYRSPSGPWYRQFVDLMGPLPRSSRGYKFILAVQDQFTKWTELVPLTSATAKSLSTRMRDAIFLRYGAPEVLLSDNGTQFTSGLFRSLADEWGIRLETTAPYSPQSNAVERQNRVVKTMLAQYVRDNHRTWDANLTSFQFALNTAVHDSTGFTPSMMCFGRELKTPRAVCGDRFETSEDPGLPSTAESQERRQREFGRLYADCHRGLKLAFTRQAKRYNLRRREVQYAVGAKVMRRVHHLSSAAEGVAAKLCPKYAGPCEITQRRGANMYVVREEGTGPDQVVHVKDLKPFHERTGDCSSITLPRIGPPR